MTFRRDLISDRYLDRRRFEGAGEFPFSVSLLTWAYNEEDSIVPFLRRARAFMDALGVDYEHILLDDGSEDRTFALASAFRAQYPKLRILREPNNRDVGWAIRTTVAEASKDVFFWQTVDWCYDIDRMSEYLWYLRDYDVVQGARTSDPEKLLASETPSMSLVQLSGRSDNYKRNFQSLLNWLVLRGLFGVPVLDFQNVSIYPTRFVQSLHLESHSAFTNPEILIKAYREGARIKQVPIGFVPRDRGTAKGARWQTIRGAAEDILACWLKWRGA